MAIVRPFRAFRPAPKYAKQVASRPYDVLDSAEARKEAAGNPLSFLHVGKPEIDLPPEINSYDESVYKKGMKNLQRLIADGVLRRDEQPSLYLYSQTMGDHTQHGIVGCVSVQEYVDGTIKKHELTRPDKEDDRTKHILATHAQTGPILMAYQASRILDTIIDATLSTSPEYDFVAEDGIRHQLRVIDQANTIRNVEQAFTAIKHLYIADGHHRSAAGVRAAHALAAASHSHTGTEEYNFFLAVLFPHNQLKIMDYNRVVKDLNGRNLEEFLRELKTDFDVEHATSQVRPAKKGEFGMYVKSAWYKLTANPQQLSATDPVERLDVSVLQKHVLAPLLGIKDQRTDKRIDFVGGIRGLGELEKRVDSGEMAVAFSLYPTSIEELFAIADAGKIMPPKSTWFEPKLRDGVVIHLLS